MVYNELKTAFGLNDIPETLTDLLQFDHALSPNKAFSQGFEFYTDEENSMLKTYSNEDDFLNSFIVFAQADGTGSLYAFWITNQLQDLNRAPIVAFGGQGGYHIIAQNIQDLLTILTYDVEPMIDWDSVSYFKDEDDYEPSKYIDSYRNWLAKNHSIAHTDNANEIMLKAQKETQVDFNNWIRQYYVE